MSHSTLHQTLWSRLMVGCQMRKHRAYYQTTRIYYSTTTHQCRDQTSRNSNLQRWRPHHSFLHLTNLSKYLNHTISNLNKWCIAPLNNKTSKCPRWWVFNKHLSQWWTTLHSITNSSKYLHFKHHSQCKCSNSNPNSSHSLSKCNRRLNIHSLNPKTFTHR